MMRKNSKKALKTKSAGLNTQAHTPTLDFINIDGQKFFFMYLLNKSFKN